MLHFKRPSIEGIHHAPLVMAHFAFTGKGRPLVDTTTIHDFIHLQCLGCGCRKITPWVERLPEFKDVCILRDAELVDS